MRNSSTLFSEGDLISVLQGHEQKMLKAIDSFDSRRTLEENIESLCDHFEKEYRIEALSLDDTKITFDQVETQVDVRQTPDRIFYDASGPAYIQGTLFTFYVPFKGDKELFKCRLSAYNYNPPHAKVRQSGLELSYTITNQESATIRQRFDSDLAQIRKWLGWIANDVEQLNGSLRAKARERIEARKLKVQQDQDLASGIGFPRRGSN